MKSNATKLAMLLAATALVAGCNPFKKDRPKTPVLGERIPVLVNETTLAVDPETAALPFALPAETANEDWAQSGGNAAKSMGHLALGQSLGTAWSVSIGEGSSDQARLASPPVVAQGRVYTIDTVGTVRAFDARNGGQVWSTSFGTDLNRASN